MRQRRDEPNEVKYGLNSFISYAASKANFDGVMVGKRSQCVTPGTAAIQRASRHVAAAV